MSKKTYNLSEKNGQWKGENAGIGAIHQWVKGRINKPKLCQNCHKNRELELACKNHKYSRDLSVWWYICKSCHTSIDGKVKSITKNYKIKECPMCGVKIKSPKRYCEKCRKEVRLKWWKQYNKKRRAE